MGVKWYDSTDAGAPVLTGNAAGELLNLLTKCLVEGYGAKTALGWEKLGPTGHKAAYRATAPGATGCWLHVNDAGPGAHGYREARARGYRELASLDGSGDPVGATTPFPTTAQMASGSVWRRSHTADATARRWSLYGDERFFQLWVEGGYGTNHFDGAWFGDLAEYGPVAVTGIAGRKTEGSASGPQQVNKTGNLVRTPGEVGTPGGMWASETAGQSIVTANAGNFSYANTQTWAMGHTNGVPFPNNGDLRAYMGPVEWLSADGFLGAVPGLYQPFHSRPLSHGALVEVIEGPLTGRTLRTQGFSAYDNTPETDTGRVWIDITGPWR